MLWVKNISMDKISNVQCVERIALNFMTNFEVMQAELSAFIQDHQLFSTKDKLLLGVSGGVDSMTLLHLLVTLGHQVSVAHMNFSLRGEASDKDENLVKEIGNMLHVPVFTKQVAAQEYADREGVSIQMAARDLRYQWFGELVEEHHFEYILTAHNADDNLETVLFNLTKGTGIRGLRGIRPKERVLVRPLLFAAKSQILAYARANAIQWREDASNEDTKYTRNKIRHQVIPYLKEINPSLLSNFEHTRRRISGSEQILMRQVHEIREEYCSWSGNTFIIRQDWLLNQDSDAVILSELLREFDFSFSQSLAIAKAANQTGKLFPTQKFILNVDRERFIVKVKETESRSTMVIDSPEGDHQFGDWSITMVELPVSEFTKSQSVNEIYLDADTVQFPLIIRRWELGDAFQPLGMKGKKKISDFLVDRKVPLIEKQSTMVLESDTRICWVINHRIDDRCKVTVKTQKLLKITCQKSFEDGPNTV